MWNKIFSQLNLLRFGLAAAAIAVILLVLPHADHQSFSYEENQPWKYPLLTAEFDIPIYRDTASMRLMRDSIDRTFVPFVKKDKNVETENLARFASLVADSIPESEQNYLAALLKRVYIEGVIDTDLSNYVAGHGHNSLRMIEDDNEETNAALNLDASLLLTPRSAFYLIDSLYREGKTAGMHELSPEVVKALNLSINPNVTVDSATDYKYRSQEYLTVSGATGVIKTGQRIVDRGEIVTPQIFTNLNTYQEMLASQQNESRSHYYFIIGQGIFIAIVLVLLYVYLMLYRPRFFGDIRKMTFLISFITLFCVFAILMFEYVANGLYVVPFAALPVIVLVFFDARTAIFSLITTVLISSLVATFQLQFIFMELAVGLVATFSIVQLSRRSQLLRTALLSFIGYALTYFTMCLINDGNLEQFSWKMVGIFGINALILSFAYVLILVIEKLFGFTSTVTLVELSDINNPLLRRLAEEAPGTFQHSIQVSTLAAEAARAIKENPTLVRTGALYHDIGKLASPVFYTENQHGTNPHDGLDPSSSAKKIISHVTEGLALANKEKLPDEIKQFIMQHHGKGLTKYFYNTAVNQNPDKVIDKSDYSYPGPNPQNKATAIMMMADAVEAASRSLKEYTPEAIDRLVENIINGQIADGMFRESNISFKDIEEIKKVFKLRLSTIYHTRVKYPKMKKNTATAEQNRKLQEPSDDNEDDDAHEGD